MRRRGKRSSIALWRRTLNSTASRFFDPLRSAKPIESRDEPAGSVGGVSPTKLPEPAQLKSNSVNEQSTTADIVFWSININGLPQDKKPKHFKELAVRVQETEPDLIMLQESWLDASYENFTIPNYAVVLRRDRLEGKKSGYGGIIVYAHTKIRDSIVNVYVSDVAERGWITVLTDLGPILIGNWYRPPDGSPVETESLRDELDELQNNYIGTAIFGDMNVHQGKWLHFSRRARTLEGDRLQEIASEYDLRQMVRNPTRNEYLLDLLLTDIPDYFSTNVKPPIADHSIVEATMSIPIPRSEKKTRYVWHYRQAQWGNLRARLNRVNWSQILEIDDVDECLKQFNAVILEAAHSHIPYKRFESEHSNVPWISQRCRDAVNAKNNAHGTRREVESRDTCSNVLKEEYSKYIEKLKTKLAELPKGSKQWWRLNRQLLDAKSRNESIPPLKDEKGWIFDAREKADAFASSFSAKSNLPVDSGFCEEERAPSFKQSKFMFIRKRWVRQILKDLDVNKATGPDMIPGKILKECACALTIPILLLARKILHTRRWPWKHHHIQPVFKRKSPACRENYRGVHLTSVLSKVIERIFSKIICAFFEGSNAYGSTQWAFRSGYGSRDLVTLCILRWIEAIDNNQKVGLFLSDISGAFDRVSTVRLMRKLRRCGLTDEILELLEDYLSPRSAQVIVSGAKSKKFVIEDEVYQGTVLGPPLWNVHFEDVSESVPDGFSESKFADDLNVYKAFPVTVENEQILEELSECQTSIHDWGAKNQVIFDETKEEYAVISRVNPHGTTFKLLGAQIDPKLLMTDEISRILGKARGKAKAFFRTMRYYSVGGLIAQFKTHVLCHLEGTMGAFFHASTSHLAKLNAVQRIFVEKLGLSEESAFLNYNLAPLQLRRDIAALGMLHKVTLNIAKQPFLDLFPPRPARDILPTRLLLRRHTKQLKDRCDGRQSVLLQNSLFGMARVYNLLPQRLVDSRTVKIFQRNLTKLARDRSMRGIDSSHMYCARNQRVHLLSTL